VSPSLRTLCSKTWARPTWGIAIVDYDTDDELDSNSNGYETKLTGGDVGCDTPRLKREILIAQGDIRSTGLRSATTATNVRPTCRLSVRSRTLPLIEAMARSDGHLFE
jgi:hypothetical protein